MVLEMLFDCEKDEDPEQSGSIARSIKYFNERERGQGQCRKQKHVARSTQRVLEGRTAPACSPFRHTSSLSPARTSKALWKPYIRESGSVTVLMTTDHLFAKSASITTSLSVSQCLR